MSSLFKVKALDYTFIGFNDYDSALNVAKKIRQAYKAKNRTKISEDVTLCSHIPGYLLIAN
jgi:hypothetical protein